MMYEYIVKVGCEHAMWMEHPHGMLMDCLRFQNMSVGNETGVFPSKCLVIWLVGLVCLLVGWFNGRLL
jgi:hypothetical protein